MSKTIAVIGTINRDTIIHVDGKKTESYGGALYNITALSQLLEDNAIIKPCINLGHDVYPLIAGNLARMGNIDISTLNKVRRKNNHCKLRYHDLEKKSEVLSGGVPSIRFSDLRKGLDADITMINFVSGRDISLRSLEKLRLDYRGKIYIDIHSLTLGKKPDGSRFLRRPRNWKRYAACADFLQMNSLEFELLSSNSVEKDSVKAFYKLFSPSSLKALLVTLGEHGAYFVSQFGRGVRCQQVLPPKVGKVLDTTGCGDVFGAGFCSAWITGASAMRSAEIAVASATLKTRVRGVENLNLPPLKSPE
ncbi:MAG: hypothetical protein GF404_13150 [candidate division Zixibacteria bacterium]|nr:hypothetical protein [candidate division Zixibacteria bacterium]